MDDANRIPKKSRHICLTIYLILLVGGNALFAFAYLFLIPVMRQTAPTFPVLGFPMLSALHTVNLLCAIALWRWKMAGFFGYALSTILIAAVQLFGGLGILTALSGLASIALLYAILQMGDTNKGWPQLEMPQRP